MVPLIRELRRGPFGQGKLVSRSICVEVWSYEVSRDSIMTTPLGILVVAVTYAEAGTILGWLMR